MRGKCESYYRYLVKYDNKEHRFKQTQEITDEFGITPTAIHYIINERNKRKWKDFKIEKIKEPVFERTEIKYRVTKVEPETETEIETEPVNLELVGN